MSPSNIKDASRPPAPEPLAVAVVDSHCHLDIAYEGAKPLGVVEAVDAAHAVGVKTLVTVGYDVASSRFGVDAAHSHDDVWSAVALHPNEAPRLAAGSRAAFDDAFDEIAALATDPAVRAIGETGLDFFRTDDEDGLRVQEESFRRHIELAKSLGKPLVIHDRDAHDAVLRVLREEGAPDVVVFHCFSGDEAMARECVAAGYVLSFAGTVTFKNATGLREALTITPDELVLVETDAPFLTPTPYRGRPNASYLIPLTVRLMAEVRSQDLDELCGAVAANSERVFGPF